MKLFHYLYPAIVRDVHDPMKSGRIKVECPTVYGVGRDLWSPWCLPMGPGHFWSVPLEGDHVWIAFREGDARYPVWLGKYTTYASSSAPAEFKALSVGPYYTELRDYVDHQNTYDNADHKKGHEHAKNEFWDPYVHVLRFPMGAGLLVDEEPGEQLTKLHDRIGQYLTFVGDPLKPLDPHDETRVGGEYDAPDLDTKSVLFSQEGLKAKLRLQGRHTQFLEMRIKENDREEELELRGANIAGDHGSHLTFSNSLLNHNLLLERFYAGHRQSYQAKINPFNLTVDYQQLFDEHGQMITINSDSVSPDLFLQVSSGMGDFVKIQTDPLPSVRIQDRTGSHMLWDVEAMTIHIEHFERNRLFFDTETILTEHRTGSNMLFDDTQIVVAHHGGNTITINGDVVTIDHVAGHSVTLATGGVDIDHVAGHSISLATAGADVTHNNGDTVSLDGTTVAATKVGGGSLALTAAQSVLSSSGASVTIGSSGVAILAPGGVTINGIPVAVSGDPVSTTVTGTSATGGPVTGTGTGSIAGSGGV